ncbi:hypothetical protein DRN67_01145 [Candidatus Micrarchaeota archaeon]|nr:MAG: hypothetical protein DRN67_01145 [Candidatus Micrarchaeota archaeon]
MKKLLLISLILFLMLPLSFSLSKIGESCQYTKDCENGYCLDSICVLPEVSAQRNLQACNVTADCPEGYCLQGTCILPRIRGELIGFGLKSGCEGLVQETDTLSSLILCGSIWLLVILFAIASAYTSHKKRFSKLITATAFILPFFTALLLFPFVGMLVGLIELALLVKVRNKR